jgi:hypothetical protein
LAPGPTAADVSPVEPPPPEPAAPPAVVPLGEPAASPWGADPVAPETVGLALDPFTGPPVDAAPGRDFVRVDRPRFSGSALAVTGGVLVATAFLKQGIQALICGIPYCGLPAASERALIGAGFAFIAGGAFRRGRWDAYSDAITRAPAHLTRTRKIAGWTMAALAAAGLVIDMGLHGACLHDRSGPLVDGEWGCNEWPSAALMNASALVGGAGLGLGVWATKYGRDARFYRGARVVPMPLAGRGQVGLALTGGF